MMITTKAISLLTHGRKYLALPLILINTQAYAIEADFDFAGFATFAYAKAITDADEGNVNNGSITGEIPREGEYRDFNKLGLRLDVDFEDQYDNLSFAAQAIAYGREDYSPKFDWIYASYSFTPTIDVAVGKTRIPLFLYSDYIDVSYAQPWLSPPNVVYDRAVINTVDGINFNFASPISENWNMRVQAFYGEVREKLEGISSTGGDVVVEGKDSLGTALTFDNDWFSVRAVYTEMLVSIDGTQVDTVIGLMDTVGTAISQDFSELTSAIDLDKDQQEYYSVGMTVDLDTFFGGLEATKSELEDNILIGDGREGYYIFLGTRLPAKWSLSLTYGKD